MFLNNSLGDEGVDRVEESLRLVLVEMKLREDKLIAYCCIELDKS